MGPGDLTKALSVLRAREDPRLVVGHETYDDAGIFVLAPDLALVQTVDFFAPIVDDPFLFGQIAAANALSDVYAMGGEPLTALNIVGFPTGKLPIEVLGEILRGGQEMVHSAGALVVGGHTIIDDEVKFGLAVTGRAHPDRLLRNSQARIGDRLILTKPLGTGILATANKNGTLAADHADALYASMRTLNATASRAALSCGAICATDVTGFGLVGHALHMAAASNVTMRVVAADVPLLAGTREAVAAGIRTGGSERNDTYLATGVEWGALSADDRAPLLDPQTSGGLLVCVSAPRVAEYLSLVPGAVVIGEVVAAGTHRILLV
jgi:selenide,water dikinase